MRKLLLTVSLLLAHAGAARAEAGAPPVRPEKPAKAQKAGAARGARPAAAKGQKPAAAERGKASAPPPETPCQPVKPCPID